MSDQETQAEDAFKDLCPKCFHTIGELLIVNEHEKERYVSCILAGTIYTKEYKLFDGRIKIVMRSLTSEQADRLAEVLSTVDLQDPKNSADIQKIKICFYMAQYRDTEYEVPMTQSKEELLELFSKNFGELSEDVVGILVRTLLEFVRILGFLLGAGFDKDFWKGVGID